MLACGPNQIELPKPEFRMAKKESRTAKLNFLLFPSAFEIRYSIFCGSILNLNEACEEIPVEDSRNRIQKKD